MCTRSKRLPTKKGSSDVHPLPDIGARKGISLQSLPDSKEAHRDSPRSLSHRKANQDLVPEPENEAQEGAACRQGDQRTGEAGTRRAGEAQTAAAGEAAGQDGSAAAAIAPSPPRSDEDVAGEKRRLGSAEDGGEGAHLNKRKMPVVKKYGGWFGSS